MNIRKGFTVILVGALIGSFCGFLSLLIFAEFLTPGLNAFLSYLLLDSVEYVPTPDEVDVLNLLIKEGVVSSPQSLFDNIVSFYTAVIEILIALIGVIAAATFFYIKATTEEKVLELEKDTKRKVAEEVQNKFEKQEFHDQVSNYVNGINKPELDKIFKNIEEIESLAIYSMDINELLDQNEKLAAKVKYLEAVVKDHQKFRKLMIRYIQKRDTSEAVSEERLEEDESNGNS